MNPKDDIKKVLEGIVVDVASQVSQPTPKRVRKAKVVSTSEVISVPEETVQPIKPSDLVQAVNSYVIGQDSLKRTLAVYLATHYNVYIKLPSDVPARPVLLITGQSGTGKSYTVQCMARQLKKCFVSVDVTTLTPAGYKGENVDVIWTMLQEQSYRTGFSGADPIIFLDEIDKLGGEEEKDYYIKIQSSLLKELERREPGFSPCFIAAGAFEGARSKKRKLIEKRTVGFDTKGKKDDSLRLTHEDIIKSGMLPELVGRIGNIIETDPITTDMLRDLLTKPYGCVLDLYNEMFNEQGINDYVTEKDIDTLIKLVESKGLELGVRGIRGIAEQYFLDRLYF